jgi:hypothetical protein
MVEKTGGNRNFEAMPKKKKNWYVFVTLQALLLDKPCIESDVFDLVCGSI